MSSTFKHKPPKIKFLNKNNTLDELHNTQITEFKKKNEILPQKRKRLELLEKSLKKIKNGSLENLEKRNNIKEQIKSIKSDINKIETHEIEIDYYETHFSTLKKYYDIKENENKEYDLQTNDNKNINKLEKLNLLNQQKRKPKKIAKKRFKLEDNINAVTRKRKNIMEFLVKDEQYKKSKHDVADTKTFLYEQYLLLGKKNFPTKYKQIVKQCEKCGIEKTIIQNEGICVCKQCGEYEHIIIDNNLHNYKNFGNEKPAYPYKRTNHLTERLNQFQAKESTEIPKEIYINILKELKKNKIKSIKSLTFLKLKVILKKLKYNKYYEHIPHILSKIKKEPAPILSRAHEEKIKLMFRQIQIPFKLYCPKNRTNFLNYDYTLHKFFELLGLHQFLQYFPLLKSREKLRQQDIIWEKICNYMGWKYYASI